MMNFPNLFSSININGLELKNRIVMTAMHLGYTPQGEVTGRFLDFYIERARGGVGLIIVGGCPIDEQGSMSGMLCINDDRFIPGLTKLTSVIKNEGAKIAAQLYQAGRYTHSSLIGGKKPFSASAVRSTLTGEIPRPLELEEIPQVQNRFAEAGVRAKNSGFDAVEILGSAGYLVSQFLSPITNRREDDYGGTFDKRMRFGLEVVEKVRRAVGPSFPIFMRLAGNEFMEGGNSNEEAQIFARELEKVGVDLFDITGGWHETRVPQLTMSVPRRAYVYLAQGVKSAVSVPVLSSNRINDPQIGEKILSNGEADLITMARALIADPELPKKAKGANHNRIYHCVACNQGCFDSIFKQQPVTCLINPRAGLEKETEINPVSRSKKVLVIGGGPAGLKAACTGAERGHKVTLAEKSNRLGGQLLLNANIPGREELVQGAIDLIENLYALDVDVILGKEADKTFIEEMGPDALILATGARPFMPKIQGIEDERVVTAWDLLSKNIKLGQRVIIVGGNAVGVEAALYVSMQGTISPEVLYFLAANNAEKWDKLESLISKGNKQVVLVEMEKRYGQDIGASTRWAIVKELKRLGVKVLTHTEAIRITQEGLEVRKMENQEVLPADSIVIAAGAVSENSLEEQLQSLIPEFYIIGDAKEPRNALEAIKEGFFAGLNI